MSVPAHDIVCERLKLIDPSIAVERTGEDFDSSTYTFHIRVNERKAKIDITLPEELLEDLQDNPERPTSEYSQNLLEILDDRLREQIEETGVISFGEHSLKFRLLKHIAKSGSSEKFNVIGRSGEGSLEQDIGYSLSQQEKHMLVWAWDELRRERLIAPTAKDIINPDGWCELTEKGQTVVQNDDYPDYISASVFLDKGEVYTGYRKIMQIMKKSKKLLIIIDPYMSEDVLDMIVQLPATVDVKIITKKYHGNFKTALTKLKQQRGNIEVRLSDWCHDRFLVLDKTCGYQLGGSIKDAGKTAMVLNELNQTILTDLLKKIPDAWKNAKLLS